MRESGNFENGGHVPSKNESLTEKAVAMAVRENTTPVPDVMDIDEQKEIRDRFPVTNDDRLPEDMARHIVFDDDGYDSRMLAKDNTRYTEIALAEMERKIQEERAALEKIMEEEYRKANGQENFQQKLDALSSKSAGLKVHFDFLSVVSPQNAAAITHAQREIQDLEDEIDSLQRRTVPGSNEKLLQKYQETVKKYDELGQLVSPGNASLN